MVNLHKIGGIDRDAPRVVFINKILSKGAY